MGERTKKHTEEFKLQAVRLVVDEGMRASQVCKDLDIASSSLAGWLSRYKKHGQSAFPGKGYLSPQDQKMRDLEKQVRRLQMERDILKKTIAFFAEEEKKSSRR